ncbi:hypothetical protein ACWFOS_18315 [Gordonia terrae]
MAVLLLVVAGLVGFIIGGDSDRDDAAATVPLPAAPGVESLTLRQTAEKFNADAQAAEAIDDDVAAWNSIKRYAEPACAAMLDGLYAAFGGGNDDSTSSEASAPQQESSEIVSVTEDGDRGTVVMRTDGEEETIHWVRRANVWRFTCEGMFDQNNIETSAGTSTVVPETTAKEGSETIIEAPAPQTTETPSTLRTTTVPNEDPNLDQSKWAECVKVRSSAECRELLNTNQR